MSIWDHIFIEGYCMYSIMSKKNHKVIGNKNNNLKELLEGKNNYEKNLPNPDFINEKRPNWCIKKYKNGKRTPCATCLSDENNNKCPFFAFTEVDKEEKELFELIYYLSTKMYDKNDKLDKKQINKLKKVMIKEVLTNKKK